MAETMGIARDWAVILLAIESFVLSLVPLFIYWKAAQGLGKLLPKVRPFIWQVRGGVDKGAITVINVAKKVEKPLIKLHTARAAVRAFWSSYSKGR